MGETVEAVSEVSCFPSDGVTSVIREVVGPSGDVNIVIGGGDVTNRG